jgi:hypothetical protein
MIAFAGALADVRTADTDRPVAQLTQWNKTNIHGHKIYYALRGRHWSSCMVEATRVSARLRIN